MPGYVLRLIAVVLATMTFATDRSNPYAPSPDLPPGDGFITGHYRAESGPILSPPAPEATANASVYALLDNIRHTPRGATIRIVAYSFAIMPVADALIAAHRRGVHVQLVVDGRHSHAFEATQAVQQALGADHTRGSFLVLTDRSARGTVSHSHQKSWSFSRTGSSRHVVMVGSTNLSILGTTGQYSDMYSFVDRRDIWRAFSAIFRAQARDRPVPDPAVTDALGRDTAYFDPGFSIADDPIAALIADLPANPSTHIRIVMFAWHPPRGQQLVDLLLDELKGGASVEIIRGPYVRQPLDQLIAAGASVHRGVFANGDVVHDKLMIADTFRHGHRERFVTTGSDNWGNISFLRDDVDVRIGLGVEQYDAYLGFVNQLVRRGASESGKRAHH
jgi:phosphatidylserine/phosphatidylglycerophosphate/cardiolipin synthase-like enzyme